MNYFDILFIFVENFVALFQQMWYQILEDPIPLFVWSTVMVIVSFVLIQILQTIYTLVINKGVGVTSQHFKSRKLENPEKRILIAGDSTAVSAGAATPEETIPGQLARDFPKADIITIAQNGATTSQVRQQVEKVQDETFDLVIVSTGGNDIFKKSTDHIFEDADALFAMTQKMSAGHTLLLYYDKLAGLLAVPYLLRWIFVGKTDKVHDRLLAAARAHDVMIVPLFVDEWNNPFIKNPKEYLAPDRIHPNSKGYHLWYNRMWREIVRRGYNV